MGRLTFLGLVALVACSSHGSYVEAPILSESAARGLSDAGAPPPPHDEGPTFEEPKPEHPLPFHTGDAWTGDLVTSAGRASLTLRIVSARGDEVRAIVDFTRSHTGASGRFSAVGHYDGTTRKLLLEGEDWIAQPAGESVFDLDGQAASDGASFIGRVVGPGGGFFHLRR